MSTHNEQTKKDLSTLRILVAEGDQINLAVLRHLLKKGGCTFDLATSKSEIIQKHKGNNYDLLLLDLDSKDIDALLTVGSLRANEQSSSGKLLIIIGLCNNTNPSKYIDAGLNNYVLRPVKWNELQTTIDSISESPKEKTNGEKQTLNLSALFTSFGNTEMVTNILKLFMAQTPDNMNQLDEFVKAEDWDGFRILCHNMKSVYALIGLSEIKNHFDEMERDCNANAINVEKFKNYLAKIKDVNAKAISEMEKALLINAG